MQARLRGSVRLREEPFGGIAYVPERDDFFACTHDVFGLLQSVGDKWKRVSRSREESYRRLAQLELCDTRPSAERVSYSGLSLLGAFADLPAVTHPLVLNCFATAHCPLKCIYCHADDLMQEFREDECDSDLARVIDTANAVPAIVAVITGGDPLTRPNRAKYLIEALAAKKRLVLDTSGVGDIEGLLSVLKKHGVHVRVSLDAVSDVNTKLRPLNRQYVRGAPSGQLAQRAVRTCIESGLSTTVQTVATARNESLDEWYDLRDWLIDVGVQHWVIHVAVRAGSARVIENAAARHGRARGILPSALVYDRLSRLVRASNEARLPIDIRVTDTNSSPNSVLLVSSKGDLYTEGLAHNGKLKLYAVGDPVSKVRDALSMHWDRFGHARRYLNWNSWATEGSDLRQLCVKI